MESQQSQSEGWDWFNQPQQPPITPEQEAIYSAYDALFGTPLGQKVLADLRKNTIEQPSMPPQAADGVALGMLMSCREGENNLYRRIVSNIKKGSIVNARSIPTQNE